MSSVTLSALAELFDLLDNDKDGKIDAKNVELSNINKKSLEILGPLLLEMEEGNHELLREEFIEAALRLLSTLSID